MTAMEFLLADQNVAFTVALVITLVIATLEIVSLILGLGLSDLIDGMLPDFDADVDLDLDVDADVDADGDFSPEVPSASDTNVFMWAFGWLNAGRVPMLILLVCFLGIYTVIGYVAQLIVQPIIGLLPAIVVGPAALVPTLPLTRQASRAISRAIPREESFAVSDREFVGLVGSVTLGPVERDNPGKAKLTDRHGDVHFARVRAAEPGARFGLGDKVLLVAQDGHLFDVIAPPDSLSQGPAAKA
ncbi:MAG: OB-fold-containig protein [Pseudomonadota bacterium]